MGSSFSTGSSFPRRHFESSIISNQTRKNDGGERSKSVSFRALGARTEASQFLSALLAREQKQVIFFRRSWGNKKSK
jgi:hypothetical protein